ncbi:PD40 domain-containing protein [Virgisporangium ochraceum]|uniref:WD40 repeat domain-containing protein n=1 Tax=Virgisporangium ochraceum TaxID=65505 RepID=A0A8J4A1I4_9ACTN|nr:PD40 domain-containing protein [Virgisporangium ochraceum]GIJ73098.1 hypothetical protein Voc01_080150 [Virgisporangium ochraceum]
MTRLHDAFERLAERAPEVRVPAGFYRRSRRRHRWRQVAAAVAVVAVVALGAPVALSMGRTGREIGDSGTPGIPSRVTMPPWYTSAGAPGPTSVMFTGYGGVPQADHEDVDWAWWRADYTVYPSVAVGLSADTYRIVRGPYTVGTELSPDGRYLLIPDRRVLDLTTGRTRQVLPARPRAQAAGAWSADGRRIVYVEDRRTTVVSWPSLAFEASFPHPEHVPVEQDVALSADGRMLAVDSNGAMTVRRSDGLRLWTRAEDAEPALGRARIGGSAAWRADGRLTVFARTDLTCDGCGLHPATWRLTSVDGATGTPVPGPDYPPVRSALSVEVVAWRGEVAYAVVAYSLGATPDVGRVELVRLRPGAATPERLLAAPAGMTGLRVATDFVDVQRPTGDPEPGVNAAEIVGQASVALLCLSPFALLALVMLRVRRRARRSR